jgi:hypothetical protein
MLLQWMKSRKQFVAIGVALASWATLQNDGVASGEFLTDRIGEGSILHVSQAIGLTGDGGVVYFQNGHPVAYSEINAKTPFCKFESSAHKLGEHLAAESKLVVKFKNVTKARWFFTNNVELECTAPREPSQERESFRESDFRRALGSYFQVEMHSVNALDNRQI